MPEDLDAYLREVLIGPPEPGPVTLAEYDPRWPAMFEAHRARIAGALGGRARAIEHIGSTSVPGLAAKPIIDVLVTVEDPDDEAAYLPDLLTAGYALRVREPGHRLVRPPGRDANVHVWAAGDPEVRRCLAFRDRLRRSPEDRARYEAVKRSLAGRDWPSRDHYAQAKSDVVAEILARAT